MCGEAHIYWPLKIPCWHPAFKSYLEHWKESNIHTNSTSTIQAALYYTQFTWSKGVQNSYKFYLHRHLCHTDIQFCPFGVHVNILSSPVLNSTFANLGWPHILQSFLRAQFTLPHLQVNTNHPIKPKIIYYIWKPSINGVILLQFNTVTVSFITICWGEGVCASQECLSISKLFLFSMSHKTQPFFRDYVWFSYF